MAARYTETFYASGLMNATLPTEGAADPYGLAGCICGEHRVEVLLDANGSGLVYRGAHVATKERVAIKVLRPEGDRAAFLARFADAMASIAPVQSPDIVAVKSHGEIVSPRTNETLPFVVHEWIDGTLLSAYLAERRERRMPGRTFVDTLDLVETAALALAEAHACAVVHRDVRPANLILARLRNGTHLRVLDLGIAPVLGAPHPDSTSPEQRDGGLVGPWTDIRALVLVLVELMKGDRVSEPRAAVASLDLPRGVADLLLRAVADDPHERPAHLGMFWSALRDLSRSHVASDVAFAPTDATEEVAERVQRMRAELGRQSTPSPFTGTMLMVGGSNSTPLRQLEPSPPSQPEEPPGSTAPLALPALPASLSEPGPHQAPPVSPHAMSIGLAAPIIVPNLAGASPLASSIGPQNQPLTFAMPAVTPPRPPTPQPFSPHAMHAPPPPSAMPGSHLAPRLPSVPPPAQQSAPALPGPGRQVFLLGLGIGVIATVVILTLVYLLVIQR